MNVTLKNYKGYTIDIDLYTGVFHVLGVRGAFDGLKQAEAKINKIVKAEVCNLFPIEAIFTNGAIAKNVKITNANLEEESIWTVDSNGNRQKRFMNGISSTRLYKNNPENIKTLELFNDLNNKIGDLERKIRLLEFNSPITIDDFKVEKE